MCPGDTSDQCQQRHYCPVNRARSLPSEILKVTSPRRHPFKHAWPPESHKIKKFWQYGRLMPSVQSAAESGGMLLSLSEFIKENEEQQQRPPSPKRYLLRGEQQRNNTNLQEKSEGAGNGNFDRRRYHSLIRNTGFRHPSFGDEKKRLSDSDEHCAEEETTRNDSFLGTASTRNLDSGYSSYYSTSNIEEQRQQQQRNIFSRTDFLDLSCEKTDSRAQIEGRCERQNLYEPVLKKNLWDVDMGIVSQKANYSVREEYRHELTETTESQDVLSQNENLGTVEEEEKEEGGLNRDRKFVFHVEKRLSKTNNAENEESAVYKTEHVEDKPAHFEKQQERAEKKKTTRNDLLSVKKIPPILEEHDKRIAIESIARYQQGLREPEEELSHMLDNAIDFLRNLDKYANYVFANRRKFRQKRATFLNYRL